MLPSSHLRGLSSRLDVKEAPSRGKQLIGRLTEFFQAHYIVLLWGILALALVARIIALWSLKQTPYYDYLLIDENIYHRWAKEIADGVYSAKAPYEFSPLPAYVMAFIYKIFSPNIFYIRILNMLFGVLTCLFIALAGNLLGDRIVGLSAGFIAALYQPFILYSIVPLKTALSLLLCSLILYLFIIYAVKPSTSSSLLIGICIALAINVRGNYMVFVPVIGLSMFCSVYSEEKGFKQPFKYLLFFLCGVAVALAPFTIRNYQIARKFVLSTTQAGFNFYIGNNPQNPTPYYKPVSFASSVPFVQGVEFTIEASRRAGKTLTPGEASEFWFKQAFRQGRDHPRFFLKGLANKFLALFNRFEAFDHYDVNFLGQFAPFFRLPLFNFWLVWPLGISGLVLTAINTRLGRWVLIIWGAYALTVALFFMSGRYRLPLLVILLPFVPLGMQHCMQLIRKRHLLLPSIYALVLLSSVLLQFTPLPGANDVSLYDNVHAAILASKGHMNEAVLYWKKASLDEQNYSDTALFQLADAACAQHDFHQALRYLDRIPQSSYKSAAKYDLLGDIHMAQRNLPEAAKAYQQSLRINSSNNTVRKKLIRVLRLTDPAEANRQIVKFSKISSFFKGL